MAFNVTLSTFWIVSAGQLLLLMKTLPRDQDAMEAELARYAAQAIGNGGANKTNLRVMDGVAQDNESLVSIEERMISFDNIAAQQTLGYMRAGWQELRSPLLLCQPGGDGGSSGSSSEHASSHSLNQQQRLDDDDDPATIRRKLWMQQDSFEVQNDGRNDKDDSDVQWTDETLLVPELPPTREHPDETTRLLL